MLISTITTTPRKPHRKLTSSLETHSQGKQINGKQENWKQFKNKTQTLDKTLCTLSNFSYTIKKINGIIISAKKKKFPTDKGCK